MAVRRTGLARTRRAAGFTQEKFAAAVGVEPSTVVRWEAGTREPQPYKRPLLARLLNITMAELEDLLHPEAPSVAPTPRASGGRSPADDATAGSLALRGAIAFRTISEAFQTADRKIGGGVLYGQVVRFLQDEVAPRLLVPPPGLAHREIFSAAASFTEFAGWTAHDSGRDAQAKAHLTQAYLLATTAENSALAANVLASLSHLAVQLGDTRDGERLALKGMAQVKSGRVPHLVARLHALRGRALAGQGREREARSALDAAENILDSTGTGTPDDWLSGFDQASLHAEAALCMSDLERYEDAAASAARAIALRSAGDRVRSRALAGLTRARALVELGDYKSAARAGVDVIEAADGLDSARVRNGITRLRQRLSQRGALSEIRELDDRLATSATGRQVPEQAGWPV